MKAVGSHEDLGWVLPREQSPQIVPWVLPALPPVSEDCCLPELFGGVSALRKGLLKQGRCLLVSISSQGLLTPEHGAGT